MASDQHMELRPEWQPVLSGAEARHVLGILGELAEAIDHAAKSVADPWERASAALFLGYQYLNTGDARTRECAREHTASAIELMTSSHNPRIGLHGGILGVAWIARHIESLIGDEFVDLTDVEALVDEIIERNLYERVGLADGLVGVGIYTLDARIHVEDRMRGIVAQLHKRAESRPHGLFTWCTSHRGEPTTFNIGMIHGVAGIIAFLARAAVSRSFEDVHPLVAGGIRWLLSHRRAGSPAFPYVEVDGLGGAPADTGWGYGDAAIAVAVQGAANTYREESWCAFAKDIGMVSARRGPAAWNAPGVGIGHGAAGNAFAFHHLWWRTAQLEMLEAAHAWYAELLSSRRPGTGIGGYSGAFSNDDLSLITGVSGIGLCLLASCNVQPPRWSLLLGCTL